MKWDETLTVARCFVCRKRMKLNEFPIIYEDAAIADPITSRVVHLLPPHVYICSQQCDDMLTDAPSAVTYDPKRRALDILDIWDDLYEERGADSPLPISLVEDDYPALFDFFADLFEEAHNLVKANPTSYGLPEYYDGDSMQGYHDEWPPLIQAARKILS